MNKNKKFEALIWDAFSKETNYDSLKHKLIRIRNTMIGSNIVFSKLPVKTQFDFCVTIGIIVQNQ